MYIHCIVYDFWYRSIALEYPWRIQKGWRGGGNDSANISKVTYRIVKLFWRQGFISQFNIFQWYSYIRLISKWKVTYLARKWKEKHENMYTRTFSEISVKTLGRKSYQISNNLKSSDFLEQNVIVGNFIFMSRSLWQPVQKK